MSLDRFSNRFRSLTNRVEKNIPIIQRRLASAVVRNVAQATPADTGRAISNWQVGIGSTPTGVIPAHSPGEKGSSAAQNIQQTISAAEATLAAFREGRDIIIANNLPYIQQLNQGSSVQAPANFVSTAVAAAVSELATIRLVPR